MGANIFKGICCVRKNECFYNFKENKINELNNKIDDLTTEINNQKKLNLDLEKKYKNIINLYEKIDMDYVKVNSPKSI